MNRDFGDLQIRAAIAADAHGIAEVHVRSWVETYSALLPPERLAKMTVEQRIAYWGPEVAEGGSTVWVALRDDAVVGFASAGAARDDAMGSRIELYTIYLLGSEHGSGAGQALLDAVIGDAPAYLWVAEQNPRAQAFYRRNRFTANGDVLDGTVPEIRMVRDAVGPTGLEPMTSTV